VVKGVDPSYNADIWSLGITAIELAQGRPPHFGLPVHKILSTVVRDPPPTLEHPIRWSAKFRDFIAKCLVKDPSQRADSIQMATHPFVVDAPTNECLATLIRDHKEMLEKLRKEKEMKQKPRKSDFWKGPLNFGDSKMNNNNNNNEGTKSGETDIPDDLSPRIEDEEGQQTLVTHVEKTFRGDLNNIDFGSSSSKKQEPALSAKPTQKAKQNTKSKTHQRSASDKKKEKRKKQTKRDRR